MSTQRSIGIDLARTAAIIGMVVYHTAYDLHIFYGWQINVFTGGWKLFQLSIASLFLVVVGVSAAIADTRIATPWLRAWKRFARIGSAAFLVSVATYLVDSQTYVRFGILHLIAISSLLVPAMTAWRYGRSQHMSLPMTISMIVMGILLIGMRPFIHTSFLNESWRIIGIPLGIRPEHFITVDYFPLIPWFGVIVIGYVLGDFLQRKRKVFHDFSHNAQLSTLAGIGRYSLLLYLIHQPIILCVLWVVLGEPQL